MRSPPPQPRRTFGSLTVLAAMLLALCVTSWKIAKSSSPPPVVSPVSFDSPLSSKVVASDPPTQWRRTKQGWQTLEELTAHRPQQNSSNSSRLHPLIVGSFLLLASLGVLLFFEE